MAFHLRYSYHIESPSGVMKMALPDNFLDIEMSFNEIGEDILFAGDESDTLFISSVEYNHEAAETIKNFSYMLGDEGEEFHTDSAVLNDDTVDVAGLINSEETLLDLDQIIAANSSEEAVATTPVSMEAVMPDFIENGINLDQIFDVMQISTTASYTETADLLSVIPSAVENDALEELALFNSSSLPVSALDSLGPQAGIDDMFKTLVISDES